MPSKKNRPSRLGRGLSTLMATPVPVETSPNDPPQPTASATPADPVEHPAAQALGAVPDDGLQRLPVDQIRPNRHQPRQRFEPGAIRSLAESIRRDGVMQPIVVRPADTGTHTDRGSAGQGYELIAGERRWRAAQDAGLAVIPALVRALSDEQAAEWALVENLQREDLSAIEKAEAFQRLGEQFALSHAQIAERVGLERSSVSNHLRLLDLSDFVRDLLRENMLSMGQARALLGLSDARQQRSLAERIVREGLSVRQVEQEVRRLTQGTAGPAPAATKGSASPLLGDLEKQISQQLGTKIKIKPGRKKGSGTLSIDFYSLEQFDALLARMDVKAE